MGAVISCEFHDIDHFREQLNGWDTPAIQIEPGLLNIRLRSIDLDGVIFSDIRVNRKVMDHSRAAAGWLKCVVNLSPAIFCGIEIAAGHLTILAPGREYRSVLAHGWHSIEIIVSTSVMTDEGLRLAPHLVSAPENATIPLPIGLLGLFRRLTKWAFSGNGDGSGNDTQLRSALLRALGKAFAIGAHGWPLRRHPRRIEGHDLTQQMIRYIESRFGQRITVAQIAGELNVTPRALHYAARSALGVGPLDLVKAFRLHQVRSELWAGRYSEPNITAAALAQDFAHLGRFSQQYRSLFGELPSQTLQRVRQLG